MRHSGSVTPSLFQLKHLDSPSGPPRRCPTVRTLGTGRIRQSSDFNVSVSYSVVVYFSILSGKIQGMDIVSSSLMPSCPMKEKHAQNCWLNHTALLYLQVEGSNLMYPHVTCILAAALQHQNATKTPWFASRPDFWCALHTRPKIQVGPGKLQFREKVDWDVLSTEIASAFELCVVRKISSQKFSLQPKGLNSWLSGKRERNVVCDRKLCLTSTFTNLAKL